MSVSRHERATAIFLAACAQPDAERTAFVEDACAGDPTLRAEIGRLLEGDHRPDARLRPEHVAAAIDEALRHGGAFDGSDPGLDDVALTPGDRLDEYVVLDEVDRGAMGVVYLAEDTALERRVALKVLPTTLHPSGSGLRRLREEAKALAKNRHPAIVDVYRIGSDRNISYIAMEYVPGSTLRRVTDDLRELPGPQRTTIIQDAAYVTRWTNRLADVADALEHAHRNHIVHRDVKPSNILLDDDDHPRLADFGLARSLDGAASTGSGTQSGTREYMSPEQAGNGAGGIDRRSDVFSLGIVLYEVLTLRRPFAAGSPDETLHRVKSHQPPPARTINPAVSRDLTWVIEKTLEKDPTRRYQRAAALAADLRCCAAGEIPDERPSRGRRSLRWLKRHRLRSAVTLLVVGAGALASLGVYIIDHRTCRVSVRSTPGSIIHVQRFDDATLAIGDVQAVGITPDDFRLSPGLYRFTIVDANRDFAEVTELLERPGDHVRIDVSILLTADVTDGMIAFEAGHYPFGWSTEAGDFYERRDVRLEGFWIDDAEVSNAEYHAFLLATGHPAPWHWGHVGYDPEDPEAANLADRPVVGVTPRDADLYARWCGKRLPTLYEWEAAARGPAGHLYPWGAMPAAVDREPTYATLVDMDSKDPAVRYAEYCAHTFPVRSAPELCTVETGLFHMFGNVRELTASVRFERNKTRIVKGSSWADSSRHRDLTNTATTPTGPGGHSLQTGFRCVKSISPPQ